MPRLLRTALALGVIVTPFWANGLRYSPHEPHREALVALLGLVALVALGRPTVRREAWPLLLALVVWGSSWLLSAVFALSPALALAGTNFRADGAALQVGLFGAVALGWGAPTRIVGRWLWRAGSVVSGVVIAQWVGLFPMDFSGPVARPPGTLGLPPFTAGWLTLALLWATVARPVQGTRSWRWGYGAGLLLMAFAVVLTGTRGAVLALGGATGMAVLLDERCWRTLAWGVGGTLLVMGGVFAAHQVQPIPLIDRLDERAADYSNRFRTRLWANTLTIAHFAAPVLDATLQPDPLHPLRPVIGYGPDHLERLHRPYAYADRYFRDRYAENQVIDRAHNDWLDVLVTQGWLGWGARLGLWLGVYAVALRRLRIFWPSALVWPLAFGAVGAVALWGTPWVTLAGTAGLLLGMALGVLRRARPPAPDLPGRLALLLLPAHLIDLQFSFVVVANTWLFWLMLGVLLAGSERPLDVGDIRWALFPAGFLLLREWGGLFPVWAAHPAVDLALMLLPLALALTLVAPPRPGWRWGRVVVALLVGGSYLTYDILADIRYQRQLDVVAAAAMRPWDMPLQAQAARVQISRDAQAGIVPEVVPPLVWLAQFNRYEPDLAYSHGWAALLAGDPSAPGQLYAAHVLVPTNPTYCALIPEICPP